MTARVLLDLNLPAFQDDLLALEVTQIRLILKTLRKVRALDWAAVYRDPGLKWEQIKGEPGLFTIRLSRACRALVVREGDAMRFVAVHADHDQTYGRK
ncbi:hypothetical protein [Candidatus Thiodictyon syntrophicum]|jgi:hypothetical protein|uniref:Cytotoxic translational repressor of toxin-antitoxin stability system n=1 Tax=Candidatus Thiodictyon syntrophicum TaxID=1166950 RepID=A0A2K8UF15_9GAMM|nr:hypothetical protein [Candidatus Thiodictyon syntrophicum]AUB84135.1 hypothetical protein THSYN_26495 [Candidatus Thiodictyon syntrophicum]